MQPIPASNEVAPIPTEAVAETPQQPVSENAAPSAASAESPPAEASPVTEGSEPQTAHLPVDEPFGPTADKPPKLEAGPVATRNPRDLLVSARVAKQNRIQKKLDKIMEMVNAEGSIANDDVEKLLHVSDAMATRYLSELEKAGKIQQVGKTGRAVRYTRV